MESNTQIVKKETKTFVRRRRLPPSPSLSSSSSVPLNPVQSLSPHTSTAAVPPLKKKTRDLPNFSECHSCGFRIDAVDGRSKLNSLYSEWRIVLLCKKCFSLVESSQVCSYCFSDSTGDCFNCCECNRRVHIECFSQHSRSAPWSYSSSSSENSVCIDCWVPKPILTARVVSESKKIRGKNINDSDFRSSKISTVGSCKSLSDLVKDAESLVEKKIDAAARAREQAVKKAAAARRASELASDALNLVALRQESVVRDSGEFAYDAESEIQFHRYMSSSPRSTAELANDSLNLVAQKQENIAKDSGVADDLELAIQLHRTMNSSPRLSKNLCTMNSNYIATQNTGVDDGNPSVGAVYPLDFDVCKTPHVLAYSSVCMCTSNAASEPSGMVKCHISPADINHSESDGCKDTMKSISHLAMSETETENVELPAKGQGSSAVKLTSYGHDDNSSHSEPQRSYKQEKHTMSTDERCITKPYHYFFKYRRRDTSKRYLLKYSKRSSRLQKGPDCRPNILVDGICLGLQPASTRTLISSSEECPEISNASSGSCALPLQASGVNAV